MIVTEQNSFSFRLCLLAMSSSTIIDKLADFLRDIEENPSAHETTASVIPLTELQEMVAPLLTIPQLLQEQKRIILRFHGLGKFGFPWLSSFLRRLKETMPILFVGLNRQGITAEMCNSTYNVICKDCRAFTDHYWDGYANEDYCICLKCKKEYEIIYPWDIRKNNNQDNNQDDCRDIHKYNEENFSMFQELPQEIFLGVDSEENRLFFQAIEEANNYWKEEALRFTEDLIAKGRMDDPGMDLSEEEDRLRQKAANHRKYIKELLDVPESHDDDAFIEQFVRRIRCKLLLPGDSHFLLKVLPVPENLREILV